MVADNLKIYKTLLTSKLPPLPTQHGYSEEKTTASPSKPVSSSTLSDDCRRCLARVTKATKPRPTDPPSSCIGASLVLNTTDTLTRWISTNSGHR